MASIKPVVWIYQLSAEQWTQDAYRSEVAEGERVSWPIWSNRGGRPPEAGERVVCWWAKTGSPEYGVIGWGVVDGSTFQEGIRWHPYAPSNRWAMSPLHSPGLDAAVDAVRAGMAQATMFLAQGTKATDLLKHIRLADLS